VPRLTPADVGCWVLKTSVPPSDIAPGWRVGSVRQLARCVRPTYRLDLMAAGQPCLLWLSGRQAPGVHAVGTLAGPVGDGPGGPTVEVELTLLPDPVARAELLTDPLARDAEVLRMPAGSNPSWLSPAQFDAVRARVRAAEPTPPGLLGPWGA
jgi:hypothetical protein